MLVKVEMVESLFWNVVIHTKASAAESYFLYFL